MAIMHPANVIESAHVYSEIKFYRALKEQLSDKYHVFYSLRWFSLNNGVREDSECDFLIFNPDYGFICVEVKGGIDMIPSEDGWILIDNRGGRVLDESPYEQSERSKWFFKDYFERELEMRFPGVYGNAAAFPNYCIKSRLTIGSPLEITIDLEDMQNLGKRIIEIFRYFQGRRTGGATFFAPETSKKFINLINKKIALSISAGALIEDKERELREINNFQESIIDMLIHYPRAFIMGGAGTGKTWLGIKKLQRTALEGRKGLYLCFNKALAIYVGKILGQQTDCYNFDAFMRLMLKDKYATALETNGSREYCSILAGIESLPKYDLVVVDEGQDFSEDWAMCTDFFLHKDSSLYVLYDESQNIFNKTFGEKFFIENPPFVLRYNIRNTSNIYQYAKMKTSLGLDTISNQIEGAEPEYRKFSRKPQVLSYVDSIVNKLIDKESISCDKIVILSNRKKENSVFNEVFYVGGHPISDLQDCDSFTIKFRTIQSFKGLESDIVIYINHTYKNEHITDSKRATLYTAYTRARFFLYCIDFDGNV